MTLTINEHDLGSKWTTMQISARQRSFYFKVIIQMHKEHTHRADSAALPGPQGTRRPVKTPPAKTIPILSRQNGPHALQVLIVFTGPHTGLI